MTARPPIRSIAVLGAGIVGLSAAIAFARVLPGLAVTVIETPDDPAALTDHLAGTLPSIAEFHDRIGLRERDLLAAGATHRLGTRLSDWRADGVPLVLAHGERGGAIAPGTFHQHWLNARRAGKTAAFDAFSVPATLAAADRFVHPSDDPRSPISGFGYAWRLDPPRYRDLLRALARHIGIIPVPGVYAGVERGSDGHVATLLLADGRCVATDLYLDCSGPAAPLRSALDTQWDDWRRWLPVDRLLLGAAPARVATPTDDRDRGTRRLAVRATAARPDSRRAWLRGRSDVRFQRPPRIAGRRHGRSACTGCPSRTVAAQCPGTGRCRGRARSAGRRQSPPRAERYFARDRPAAGAGLRADRTCRI
ncbi:tryptophan 7-halogenase [Sphingomonas aurantiaca]